MRPVQIVERSTRTQGGCPLSFQQMTRTLSVSLADSPSVCGKDVESTLVQFVSLGEASFVHISAIHTRGTGLLSVVLNRRSWRESDVDHGLEFVLSTCPDWHHTENKTVWGMAFLEQAGILVCHRLRRRP